MTGAAFSVSRPLVDGRAAGGLPSLTRAHPHPGAHPPASPENSPVQVLGMGPLDLLQVAHDSEAGSELTPADMQDLVSNVALDDLHKMLHLMLKQLQLPELH